jgi:hypothetical protein
MAMENYFEENETPIFIVVMIGQDSFICDI